MKVWVWKCSIMEQVGPAAWRENKKSLLVRSLTSGRSRLISIRMAEGQRGHFLISPTRSAGAHAIHHWCISHTQNVTT